MTKCNDSIIIRTWGSPLTVHRQKLEGVDIMKISLKELFFLAAIGASHEANVAKNMNDTKNETRYSAIMGTIIRADDIEDIVEIPT